MKIIRLLSGMLLAMALLAPSTGLTAELTGKPLEVPVKGLTKVTESNTAPAAPTSVDKPERRVSKKQSPSPMASPKRHIVQPGETLSAIGTFYRIPWQAIALYNRLDNPDLVEPDQVLDIPARAYVDYLCQNTTRPFLSRPRSSKSDAMAGQGPGGVTSN